MQFTFLLAIFAAALTVSAAPIGETNAQRMARGLPPLAPSVFLRASPVEAAKRGHPSGGSIVEAAKRGHPSGGSVEAAKRGHPSGVAS